MATDLVQIAQLLNLTLDAKQHRKGRHQSHSKFPLRDRSD